MSPLNAVTLQQELCAALVPAPNDDTSRIDFELQHLVVYGINCHTMLASWQVQAAVQLVLETRPQGGAAGGGSSREEVVDKLCEELLSKVLLVMSVLRRTVSRKCLACPAPGCQNKTRAGLTLSQDSRDIHILALYSFVHSTAVSFVHIESMCKPVHSHP